ncbi:MAG: molecular chaperone TorD family protein [Gordonibacter pamelaeae]
MGAPEPAVSPYEGVWRAADDGVQALLFVNPHSMEVERFMRACGLGRPEGTNEPLDHVATECELGAPGPARRRRGAARGRARRRRPPRRLARGGLRGLPRGARPRLDAPIRRRCRCGVAAFPSTATRPRSSARSLHNKLPCSRRLPNW